MSAEETKPAEETPAETPAAEAPEAAPAKEKPAAPEAAPAKEEKPAAGSADAPAKEGAEKEAEEKEEKKKDVFAEIMGEDETQAKVHKAKGSKNVTKGIVHVTATFNNTMVTVTDEKGNALGWSSSGKMGFKGSRKSTAYAAQVVSQDACRQAMSHGLKEAEVRVKGPGSGRESAVRAVQSLGIIISTITDVTPIPHNGCRPKKARRV